MCPDITSILSDWPFDESKKVRKIAGEDGSPKLQIRLPLGLEQYELEGRPDGRRPEGAESYLELYQSRLAQYASERAAAEGFVLTPEACANLRQEGMLYYQRYLLCFQIGEYAQVRRDTERNMEMFRFVHDYAERDEDRNGVDQYWPYILRMRAMAHAMERIQQGDEQGALSLAQQAVAQINELDEMEAETFDLERMRSLGVLEQFIDELREKTVPDEREIVKRRLEKAVAEENYERAAQLRDMLRAMEG